MSIRENWLRFREELERCAAQYRRDAADIRVMAVSKTRSADEVEEAARAGLDLFGENRVAEASEKFARLDPQRFPLVLIGHLQSNKVTQIGARFTGVHSVDSFKLAQKLSRHREVIQKPLDILLQVNTSGESSKSGFKSPEELREAADRILPLPFLNLRGLMTMAPFTDDERAVRNCFALCRKWSEFLGDGAVLSMGMSSDFRHAVAEGSTLLRIGTTIFGGRD